MTTEPDKTSLSFGRYLQSIRIDKGLRIEDVARETRIRPDTLIHIEEEDHENLPETVFVKGFLRAYAKAVGADEDEAVRRYISRLGVREKITTPEADLKRSGGVFWRRFLLSIGALFFLIAATLFSVSAWRAKQAQTEEPQSVVGEKVVEESPVEKPRPLADEPLPDKSAAAVNEPAAEEPITAEPAESARAPGTDTPTTELPDTAEAGLGGQTQDRGYRLNIDTVEETWLRIVIDNQEPKEYNLFPGDQIELEAATGYSLLVGNAGGVRVFLDGKQVDLPRKSGKVITIQLP